MRELRTPMGPGFFIFFREITYKGTGGYTKEEPRITKRRIVISQAPDKRSPLLREKELFKAPEVAVVEFEGERYAIEEGEWPTPEEAIAELPEPKFEQIIREIEKDLEITRPKARKIMIKRAAKEIAKDKLVKREIAGADDDDFWLILLMSEV